jgi:S1-C subfamily serine protease
VNGRSVADAADLVRIVTTLRPGQTAVFSVLRASGRHTIAVTLAARSPR